MRKKKISIIIPIYQGKKYIPEKLSTIETIAVLHGELRFEVVIVNDDPEERIDDDIKGEFFSVIVLNSSINRGIQGARIYGLSYANGEYVHFLDQDDEIAVSFYSDLLASIGDGDVAFCRCFDGYRPTYTYDRLFETSATSENIMSRPPMISPGQAIIRKTSISEFWKGHVLQHHGSDDYMLWLCMMAEGRKFVQCDKLLFRHVRTGNNYSADILRAKESDEEMVDFLVNCDLFDEQQKEIIRMIPNNQFNRKYKGLLRNQKILYLLEILLKGEECGFGVSRILKTEGVNNVAIFGAALLGERLKSILRNAGIDTLYYIDKNAKFISQDIPVYTPSDIGGLIKSGDITKPDAFIISFVENEIDFVKMLSELGNIKIFTISSLGQIVCRNLNDSINIFENYLK